MYIYGKKLDKGVLKRHNNWLRQELEDYSHPIELTNSFEKYERDFQIYENKPSYKPSDRRMLRFLRHKNFDFLSSLVNICDKISIRSLMLFLKAKDVLALSCTCKTLNSLFDSKQIWEILINRDYYSITKDIAKLNIEFPKDYYRFKFQLAKSRMHTGTFFNRASEESAELARTMRDFTYIGPTNHIRNLLVSVRMENSMIDNLKVSVSKEKNEVYLWFSGYSSIIQEKLQKRLEPLSYVLKSFKFPKDVSLVQNAFFLKDKYLVIELEEISEDQEKYNQKEKNITNLEKNPAKKGQSFIFYDLMGEIEYLIFGEKYISPFKISFLRTYHIKKYTKFSEDEINLFFDFDEDEFNKSTFLMKMNETDEIICFMKGAKTSPLYVFSLLERKKCSETVINLEYPLFDVIYSNKKGNPEGDVLLLAVDYSSNIYHVNKGSIQSLVKLNPEDNEEEREQISKMVEEHFLGRFPDSGRKCHYGIYEYTENNKRIKIEYLAVQKAFYFYFIELSNLKVHQFSLLSYKIDFSKRIFDWTILEDKIFILTDEEMGIWQFKFPEFTVKELVCPIQTQWKSRTYHGQWIRVDPCYTIIASSKDNSSKELDEIEVLIGSTQEIISGKIEKANTNFMSLDLIGFLIGPEKKYPIVLATEKIDFKLQRGRILLSATQHSFFYDMNPYKANPLELKMNDHSSIRFVPQPASQGLLKAAVQVKSDETQTLGKRATYSWLPKKKKILANANTISPNWNHVNRREKPPHKRTYKKDYWGFYNDFKNLLRHKGRKYIKNVCQSERLKKMKQCEVYEEQGTETDSDSHLNIFYEDE